MRLLEGKKGAVLNVANERSIAWHIAQAAAAQGAQCALGYLPIPKMPQRVRATMQAGGLGDMPLLPCDVTRDEDIERFFGGLKERLGTIDFLVHSMAFADRHYLQPGKFLDTPREVFAQAMDISVYSLLALARAAAPLMARGGSVLTLSYLGGQRVVPAYNVMGLAKAALESAVRYLAFELGSKNIRVNSISAGPIRTLSAMAIGGIEQMFDYVEKTAPLKRNVEGEEVGRTAVYLLSDLASGVTGQNIFVDCGMSIMGV